MNRWVLFILLLLFWVMLTYPSPTAPAAGLGQAYWQEVGVGAVASALIVLALGGPAAGGSRWLEPKRYGWALVYCFVLAGSVVKANLEVAYRVLHPAMPIRPGIVRLRTKLRHPAARTVLGNSITLCPGTLTLDIQEDGTMFVHWIYVAADGQSEAAAQIVERFEWFVEKIFE